jgi:hypothetical protein
MARRWKGDESLGVSDIPRENLDGRAVAASGALQVTKTAHRRPFNGQAFAA